MAKVKPDKKVGSRASRDRDDGAEARDARDARPHGTPVGSRAPRDRIAKVRLGDVCEVAAGQGAPQGDAMYSDEGTPFIKAGDLSRLLAGCKECEVQKVPESTVRKYKLKLQLAGSLLFAKSGMSCMKGYVYRLRSDCYVVSHLAIIKPNENVCSGYLEHCFRFNRPNGLVKDPAYPSISLADISDFVIPLPPLPAQQRIADELDQFCALKKNVEDRLAILDQIVKSLFVEMFGDMSAEMKFPAVPIGDLCEVKSGGTPDRKKAEYWQNGTIPWVKTTELQNSVINDTQEKITDVGMQCSSAKFVPAETILIAMYGQGKTRGMTGFLNISATTNQACACLLPGHKVNQKYLWRCLIQSYDRLRNLAQGAGQPNLSGKMIKEFAVPLPPRELQDQYAAFIEQLDKSKVALRETVATLDQLYRAKLQEHFG